MPPLTLPSRSDGERVTGELSSNIAGALVSPADGQ